MRGAAVHALRCAIDLDRGAVDSDAGRGDTEGGAGGRAGESASQKESREGARARLHPKAGISGRSGGVRGFVEGWAKLSQPESVSRRNTGGSGGPVHSRSGRHFRADSHCFFASAAGGGTLSAWRSLCKTADRWSLASEKTNL